MSARSSESTKASSMVGIEASESLPVVAQMDEKSSPANTPMDAATVNNLETEDSPAKEEDNTVYPSVLKQYTILLTLNLAVMIDVVSAAALFVIVSNVGSDLKLSGPDATWILNAYIITFAAFQLSAGRLADLSSAGWVFIIGIGTVSAINLILSFLNDPIVFLVLRAIQGMGAAMTIPSSYNLTVRTFPAGKARNRAIAILGLVGSVSFSLGVVIAGMAILVVPRSRTLHGLKVREILLRMDPFGLPFSVGSILLLVLALTSGPENGWSDPRFSAAFPVSIVLLVAFFVWEAYFRDETNGMLPATVWKTPGIKAFVFLNFCPFIYWTTSIFAFPSYWQQTLGRSAIESAIRLLPVGVAAFTASVLIQLKPKLLVAKRSLIFATLGLVPICFVLYNVGGGGDGVNYWKYCVPAFVIGSACAQYAFLAMNVTVITSVPPRQSGVAGGLMSVVMQLGNAIGLAIQAACVPKRCAGHSGEILARPWGDYALGFWAVLGWITGSIVVCGISLIVSARRHGKPVMRKVQGAVHV